MNNTIRAVFKTTMTAGLISLALTGCKYDYFPTEEWRTAEPEAHGMDSAKLEIAQAFAESANAWSLLVIKDGYIVSEGYYNGGSKDLSVTVNSITKSFLGTAVGIAVDKGLIGDINDPVAMYMPEYFTEENSWKNEITIEDALTMSWGFEWNNWDFSQGSDYWKWYAAPDRTAFALNREQAHESGQVWNYDCSSSHTLSNLLTRVAGVSTAEFTQENLLTPMGINVDEGTIWASDAQGITEGAYGLELTPREISKLGFLYLNNGFWETRQIVSKDWVEQSTSPIFQTTFGSAYGYQWWVNPNTGAYWASGLGGQYMIVSPEHDLIITFTTQSIMPDVLDPEQTISSANVGAIITLVTDAIIKEETESTEQE